MFSHFTQLVSDASGWAYAIVFVLAFLDVVVPAVPSETAVITAGVVASAGDLSLSAVAFAAASGAFAGDNAAYWIGRRFGQRVVGRFFGGQKSRERVQWAKRRLSERGGELIGVGRFIPGGRTAVTLTAGLVAFPWKRFALFDAAAAVGWAAYASGLGYIGGHAFEHEAWKGLLFAFGIAFTVGGVVEVTRWSLKRRQATSG
jgi:membrane-associated protein